MSPTLQTSNHLYVLRFAGYERILAPGVAGVPAPVAADGVVVRAQYVQADGDLDEAIPLAEQSLAQEHCSLLFLFPSADGTPFRSARIFTFVERTRISWQEDSHTHHSSEAQHFRVPGQNENYTWQGDARLRRQGWFLTGHGGALTLYKVVRPEVDAFGHELFTLTPVQSAAGLPQLDLSRITNGLLQRELLEQYEELQKSAARYSDILFPHHLQRKGPSPSRGRGLSED